MPHLLLKYEAFPTTPGVRLKYITAYYKYAESIYPIHKLFKIFCRLINIPCAQLPTLVGKK